MNYTYDELMRMPHDQLVKIMLSAQLAYNLQQQNVEMLRTALATIEAVRDTL